MQEQKQEEPVCEARVFEEIKKKYEITVIKPVTKGWSDDKKYYIKTTDGQEIFLRILKSEPERKINEYNLAERMYKLGVPITKPIEFGYIYCGTSSGICRCIYFVRMDSCKRR